jgi:hypothetical protein
MIDTYPPSGERLLSSNSKIRILGAATLERYTEGMLAAGFRKLTEAGNEIPKGTIYQIHGNADAKTDDEAIMESLKKELAENPDGPVLVLLHRPDEIQDRLPKLHDLLTESPRRFGLVFLGDMHIDDSFYNMPRAVKKVVPHGFFDIDKEPFDPSPEVIIVGTHTTWGDMRATIHTLEVIGEVFQQGSGNAPVLGYLGGKPASELDIDKLQKEFAQLFAAVNVEFRDAHIADAKAFVSGRNIILVDTQNQQPDGIKITFNTQLYFYGNKVRTGESSGSLHLGVSYPVIIEMNGSENIEGLKVIKAPYNKATGDIESVDFAEAAAQICKVIDDGSYVDSLKHNREQALKFNNVYVATQLLYLLEQV